jgi:hypothetical protein
MWMAQVTSPDVLGFTQLGVAGLMGALWWWERRYSRQREEQLTAAHEQILGQREHLQALLEALQGNTRVIAEFTLVQQEILHLLVKSDLPGPAAGANPRSASGSAACRR